jgi:peptide deformylase
MTKADRRIRTGDDPVLKQVAAPVLPGENIAPLMESMEWACKKSKIGVGLAAPQVGVSKRVIFLYCRDSRGSVKGRFLINPVILHASEETDVEKEGCLSYPGIRKAIRRHRAVTVEYLNERRVTRTLDSSWFEARVIQHEMDHLEGVCKVGDPDYPPDDESRSGAVAYRTVVMTAAMLAMPLA